MDRKIDDLLDRQNKKNDGDMGLEEYFSPEELVNISDYERKRLKNIKLNHEMMLEVGLSVKKRYLMTRREARSRSLPSIPRGPRGHRRPQHDGSDDEEWTPAKDYATMDHRRSARTRSHGVIPPLSGGQKNKYSRNVSSGTKASPKVPLVKPSTKPKLKDTRSEAASEDVEFSGFMCETARMASTVHRDIMKRNTAVLKQLTNADNSPAMADKATKIIESGENVTRMKEPLYPKCSLPVKNEPQEDDFIFREDCPVHGPLIIAEDAQTKYGDRNRSDNSIPSGLKLYKSKITDAGMGIWTTADLPKNVRFGPYEGVTVLDEEVDDKSGYAWQIYENGAVIHYIDAKHKSRSNWMRYVNCARSPEEQNLTTYQYKGQVYYRTTMAILAGTELLVWFGDNYGREMDIQPGKKLTVYQLHRNPDVVGWECCVCGQMFSDEIFLGKHKFARHGLRSYCCESCGNYLPSKEALMNHMQNCHHSNLLDDPPVKSRAPDKPTDLSGGDNVYSTIQTIPCSIVLVKIAIDCPEGGLISCGVGTSCEQGKVFRRTSHTGKHRYMCTECGKGFTKTGDLKEHMRTHTGECLYTCTECGKRFTTTGSMNRHMRTHTGERPYTCTVCGTGFTTRYLMKRHMRTHTGERPYKCTECGKGFTQTGILERHMKTHTGERPYTCMECGKGFAASGDMKKHMRTHTGERPFTCTECGKGFTTTGEVKQHMRTHSDERPYICTKCEKGFTTTGNLKNHMRTHTDERPYTCTECGKRFARADSLREHLRTHTGERPFTCKECGERFTWACCMKRHMKTHTGEHPHTCTECGKAFTRTDSLKEHMRRHTGERLYTCTKCGKRFITTGSMSRHMRTHTGECLYTCTECGKRFTTTGSMNRHMRTHTGVFFNV